MSPADDVRRAFEGYFFGPPCSPDDLARAERALGHPLPAALRELYLSFDGFLGPTAAPFFAPLLLGDDPAGESLVGYTLFLRDGDEFPAFFRRAVVFGSDGCGSDWGMLVDEPSTVFEWRGEMGEAFTVIGGSPLDAWLEGKRSYDELEGGRA